MIPRQFMEPADPLDRDHVGKDPRQDRGLIATAGPDFEHPHRTKGRAIMAFFNEVGGFLKENAEDEALKPLLGPLQVSLGHLQQAAMWFMNNALAKPDNAGAGAHDYMHLLGLVCLGYMWAKMAKVAQDKLKAGANGQAERMNAKLVTARFFMERSLPETAAYLARITSGSDATMALSAEQF